MSIRMFQVDAFAERPFEGNPAAVCPLEAWPDEGLLRDIAAENNLSETAFFVPVAGADGEFELRWFTPVDEVDLCGHATLASAHVILGYLEPSLGRVRFRTRSGQLEVRREGDELVMDFPALPLAPCEAPGVVGAALGTEPREVLAAKDYVAVLGSAAEVRALEPDMVALARLDRRGVAVTAPGDEEGVDFVSRFFAPALGVPEDPVTGSAHCELAPLWAARLGRNRLRARQLSRRGGDVVCQVRGDRVELRGRAALYLEGTIRV
jgi:predicted PhzF superfamily epimerase YddE/YHI9